MSSVGGFAARPPHRSATTAHVAWRSPRFVDHPGPRRAADFYDQRGELLVLQEGDRLFVPCEGGPSSSRLELYPPRLEVAERGGTYVLVDDGPRSQWSYVFVPDEA